MNEETKNELLLSNAPLPEDENAVILDIVSYENQLRPGLPQKQLLEGKITLNTARCLVFSLPQVESVLEQASVTVDRTLYDLYLVIVPFTLHKAPGSKYYTEMTLWIELTDQQNTAFDLCPKNIFTYVEGTKTYIISAQNKFQESEPHAEQVGGQLRFDVLHPTITASGEGENILYWTYKTFEEQKEIISETTRHVLFIVQVPHGTTSLQGQISYEIVMAKKFLREWVSKDCSVDPYIFAWDLTRSQPFLVTESVNKTTAISSKQDYVDVCIVCAIAEEAEAFINAVEAICNVKFAQRFDSKNREYRAATIQNNKGELLKLHVSWPASYGLVEVSLYLPAVLSEFNPRIAIMTGICAGDKEKVHLGDIVVADRTFIYDEGKVKPDQNNQPVLHPDLKTYVTHSDVLSSVRMFDGWKPLVASLGRPLPACHVAAIASGNAVRSDNPFAQIQRAVRNAIALDMEGAAFYRCIADFPGMRALFVKGICDYADNQKNDAFHAYAASASAMYALAFIKEYVSPGLMPRFSKD